MQEQSVERNGVIYTLTNADLVDVEKDGKKLGDIFIHAGDWDLIKNGADPISDGWEDGIGNPLSMEGWGAWSK